MREHPYDWEDDFGFEWDDQEVQPEEETDTLSPETTSSLRERAWGAGKKLGVAAMAAAAINGYVIFGDTLHWPKKAAWYLTDKDCGSSDKQLQDVRRLIRSPENEIVARAYAANATNSDLSAYKTYTEKRAVELGLTPVDGEPYIETLKTAESVDDILDTLNGFTKQYGFSVSIKHHKDWEDQAMSKETYVKEQNLDINKFRIGATHLIDSLYSIPAEFVKASGLKQLRIVNVIHEEKDWTVASESLAESHHIRIALEAFYEGDPKTYYHEVGHGLDYEVCGDFGNERDPEYKHLNPFGFKYGHLKSWQNLYVVDEYAQSSVEEDKAEMDTHLFQRLEPDFYKDSGLRQKYLLMVARLDRLVPGAAEYLAAISPR